MIASPEDARLFFDRWKEDAPPLKVRLWASSLFFDAVGTVTDFTLENLELSGDSWKFTIPLEGVGFSFPTRGRSRWPAFANPRRRSMTSGLPSSCPMAISWS